MSTILEIVTGSRNVLNTEFEVVTQVKRDARYGKPQWVVIRGLCNGVADSSQVFSTRKAALQAVSQ